MATGSENIKVEAKPLTSKAPSTGKAPSLGSVAAKAAPSRGSGQTQAKSPARKSKSPARKSPARKKSATQKPPKGSVKKAALKEASAKPAANAKTENLAKPSISKKNKKTDAACKTQIEKNTMGTAKRDKISEITVEPPAVMPAHMEDAEMPATKKIEISAEEALEIEAALQAIEDSEAEASAALQHVEGASNSEADPEAVEDDSVITEPAPSKAKGRRRRAAPKTPAVTGEAVKRYRKRERRKEIDAAREGGRSMIAKLRAERREKAALQQALTTSERQASRAKTQEVLSGLAQEKRWTPSYVRRGAVRSKPAIRIDSVNEFTQLNCATPQTVVPLPVVPSAPSRERVQDHLRSLVSDEVIAEAENAALVDFAETIKNRRLQISRSGAGARTAKTNTPAKTVPAVPADKIKKKPGKTPSTLDRVKTRGRDEQQQDPQQAPTAIQLLEETAAAQKAAKSTKRRSASKSKAARDTDSPPKARKAEGAVRRSRRSASAETKQAAVDIRAQIREKTYALKMQAREALAKARAEALERARESKRKLAEAKRQRRAEIIAQVAASKRDAKAGVVAVKAEVRQRLAEERSTKRAQLGEMREQRRAAKVERRKAARAKAADLIAVARKTRRQPNLALSASAARLKASEEQLLDHEAHRRDLAVQARQQRLEARLAQAEASKRAREERLTARIESRKQARLQKEKILRERAVSRAESEARLAEMKEQARLASVLAPVIEEKPIVETPIVKVVGEQTAPKQTKPKKNEAVKSAPKKSRASKAAPKAAKGSEPSNVEWINKDVEEQIRAVFTNAAANADDKEIVSVDEEAPKAAPEAAPDEAQEAAPDETQEAAPDEAQEAAPENSPEIALDASVDDISAAEEPSREEVVFVEGPDVEVEAEIMPEVEDSPSIAEKMAVTEAKNVWEEPTASSLAPSFEPEQPTNTVDQGPARQPEATGGAEPAAVERDMEALAGKDLSLSCIEEIGEGMRQRLLTSGIADLSMLASADLTALREELGPVSRFANLERWQSEAIRLVEE